MASRILIIGATGYIGRFITNASIALGHPTTILVRESAFSDAQKSSLLDSFKSAGVSILKGSIDDHETLLKAIKSVDVVISTVGSAQIVEQSKIIKAIKEAGNVKTFATQRKVSTTLYPKIFVWNPENFQKRFLPSEFGVDVDRVDAVEPTKSIFALKSKIRREVEAEGIPFTFVACNFFAGYVVPSLGSLGLQSPPREKITILGDGNAKVVYVKEEEIGTYAIKAVDDPRTLNKVLYMRPLANTLSSNELVEMWEKKIGKTLEKTYLTEEQVLKAIAESPIPENIVLAIYHACYVRGSQTNFEIGENGTEATALYPDVKYTTVDEMLNHFV